MGHTVSSNRDIDSPIEEESEWMHTVSVSDKYANDKLSKISSGFRLINNNTIIKSTEDATDGARWSRGFRKGKHIFEIGFPSAMRGKNASVGVGTKMAPISAVGNVTLVGSDEHSWGIDLSLKKAVHNGSKVRTFPKGSKTVMPDRFYMYLNLETRTLIFGSDDQFFGTAIADIGEDGVDLFPMVSASKPGATISLVYRGKGKIVNGPLRKRR